MQPVASFDEVVRRQIHDLQEEIQQLEEQLAANGQYESSDTRRQQPLPLESEAQPSSILQEGQSIPRFVGEESGIEYG